MFQQLIGAIISSYAIILSERADVLLCTIVAHFVVLKRHHTAATTVYYYWKRTNEQLVFLLPLRTAALDEQKWAAKVAAINVLVVTAATFEATKGPQGVHDRSVGTANA